MTLEMREAKISIFGDITKYLRENNMQSAEGDEKRPAGSRAFA